MVTVESLGGSGEDARNCYFVQSGEHHILLDCGVRRELSSADRVYPLLTKEIATRLDAVFLSHAHEDHSAALPYLYELGYRGPIFCHPETIQPAKHFMTKWIKYVKDNSGILPFEESNIDKLDFFPVQYGSLTIPGLHVVAGRSAHMLGSLWYHFDFSGTTLLYTGDICVDSLLLKLDELPRCNILVTDSAYATKVINQEEQYRMLLESINTTIGINGTVLLPVPPNGRGIDFFLYLLHHRVPLVVDKSILENCKNLRTKSEWISDSPLWQTQGSYIEDQGGDIDDIAGRAIICPDGMMTSPVSIKYFERIRHETKNKVIISGHTAKGSLGNLIQDPESRKQQSIQLEVESITIKVHQDQNDTKALIQKVQPSAVMLFHAKTVDSKSLTTWLEEKNIRYVCQVSQLLSY